MKMGPISKKFQTAGGLFFRHALALSFFAAALSCAALAAKNPSNIPVDPTQPGDSANPHSVSERHGTVHTKNGLTLRLSADLGSVRIVPLEAGAGAVVRYTVHLETDARPPLAQQLLEHYTLKTRETPLGVEIDGKLPRQFARGKTSGAQFWVQYEVAVPANYSLEITTDGGDIQTPDVGGIAYLTTAGGSISAGRIGVLGGKKIATSQPVAKLSTEGGHIQVLDVAGDLSAFTAGGHINAGNIEGSATLRSGGGHIRVGQIGGRASLETDGGNITVSRAGNFVSVRTGGGQIDFGEVRGSVQAQTGGGGIRILYVSGPMEVESSGGSICLTRVAGSVRAATGDGTITAWINPDSPTSGSSVQLAGASQLSSGNGDIVVFLPRNLAANIDAMVAGDEHRIEADPSLHLTFQTTQVNGAGQVHAWASLNGGGAPLKLKTTSGKIRLQFLDSDVALRESLMREQQARVHEPTSAASADPSVVNVKSLQPLQEIKSDWLDTWLDKLEVAVTGGLHEDSDDFQKRLLSSPRPAYPALAQRAGIQGFVKLQVRVLKDGSVEVQKLLEGEPVLADAAITAVKQWRAKPVYLNGQPLEVISTVTFNFQLH
jgi:TonB family protein